MIAVGAGHWPMAGKAMADGRAAPAKFIEPYDARPLDASALDRGESKSSGEMNRGERITARWTEMEKHRIGEPSNAWRLRWRTPQRPADVSKSKPEATAGVSHAVFTWRDAVSSARSYVRTAAQLEEIDPFDDPFGDKAAKPAQPQRSVLTTPTGLQPATSGEQPQRPQTPPENVSEGHESAPPPPDMTSPPPKTRTSGESKSGSSQRVYNERECCAETEKCQAARHQLRENPIANISLDITPLLTLAKREGDVPRDYERELGIQLAKAPARVWKNRQGEVVADGTLTGFQNGRVVIAEQAGSVKKISFADLSDDDMCFVAAWWNVPTECALGDEVYQQRDWLASAMTWKASALCHKPLYFEEVQLERYGHTTGPLLEPVVSGAHFFLNIAALPYQIGLHPPNECQYALGYYRPGNCAPWLVPPLPFSVRGALLEAGAWTGGVFIIP